MLYLDGYLLINWWMDTLLLWGTSRICKCQISPKRLVLGGLAGGIYSCILLFVRLSGLVHILVSFLGMSIFMCEIAFRDRDLQQLGKKALVFCFLAFVTGGMLDAFYYGFGSGFVPEQQETIPKTGILLFLAMAGIFCLIRWFRSRDLQVEKEKQYVKAVIEFPEGKVTVMGLFDTGNRLQVAGKPVGVLEAEALGELVLLEQDFFPVFYQSVGEKDGTMMARMAENIQIEPSVMIFHPLIAFSKEKVSSDGTYQMLLPTDWRSV